MKHQATQGTLLKMTVIAAAVMAGLGNAAWADNIWVENAFGNTFPTSTPNLTGSLSVSEQITVGTQATTPSVTPGSGSGGIPQQFIDNGDGTTTIIKVVDKDRTDTMETTTTGSAKITADGSISLNGGTSVKSTTTYDVADILVVDSNNNIISQQKGVAGVFDTTSNKWTAGMPAPVVGEPTKLGGGKLTVGGMTETNGQTNHGALTTDTLQVNQQLNVGGVAENNAPTTIAGTETTPVDTVNGDGTTTRVYYRTGEKQHVENQVAGSFGVNADGQVSITSRQNVVSEAAYDVQVTEVLDANGNVVSSNESQGVYDSTSGAFTPSGIPALAEVSRTPVGNTTGAVAVGNNSASLGVRNAAGEMNGVSASTTDLTLRGGTGTTTAVLNDSGLTLTTTAPGTSTVTGLTTIDQNGNLTLGTGNLTVAGVTTTNGITNTGNVTTDTLTTTGDATVGGKLTVSGAATTNGITNTGDVKTDTLTTTGDATVGGKLTVSGAATTNGITNTGDVKTDTLTTTGDATVGGKLIVSGAATTNGITNTGNVTTDTLTTTGDATVGGKLTVSGAATTNGITNTGDITNTGKLTNTGDATFSSGSSAVAISSAAVTVSAASASVTGTTSVVTTGGSTSLSLSNSGASFAGASGVPVKVTGIANGSSTYDAVNYGQLTSLRDRLVTQLDDAEKKLSGGIASAVAMTNIPQLEQGKNGAVGVGVGHYNGKNAFALGARFRVNDSTVVNASVGTASGSGTSIGVGAGMSW